MKFKLLALLILAIALSSCSALQYRYTEQCEYEDIYQYRNGTFVLITDVPYYSPRIYHNSYYFKLQQEKRWKNKKYKWKNKKYNKNKYKNKSNTRLRDRSGTRLKDGSRNRNNVQLKDGSRNRNNIKLRNNRTKNRKR